MLANVRHSPDLSIAIFMCIEAGSDVTQLRKRPDILKTFSFMEDNLKLTAIEYIAKPRKLKHYARMVIRRCIPRKLKRELDKLDICPPAFKGYIAFKDFESLF